MKQILRAILLAGGLDAVASACRVPFLKTKASPPTKSLLEIRGGAVDPKDVFAGAMTAAGLGQGFVTSQAPELTKEVYGSGRDAAPYSIYLTRVSGTAALSVGVTAFSIFFMNQDATKAIGWGSVVWLIEKSQTLLNKTEHGMSPAQYMASFVVALVCVHACFSGAAYAKNYLLGAFGVLFANAVLGLLAPKTTAELQGVDPENLGKDQIMSARDCYWQNIAMCTFVICLLRGIDPHRALGYTSLPIVGDLLQVLLGDVELGGNANVLLIMWLVFHTANFYTLGLKG